MRMSTLVTLVALAAGVVAGIPAAAYTFDDVTIESWTGTGANAAVMAVDFGAGERYFFGYRWDGVAYGWDMIEDIVADTTLDVDTDTTWGGHVVSMFSYNGTTRRYDPQAWRTETHYWGYWVMSDGHNWAFSWDGCDDRVLSNGVWDGWVFTPVVGESLPPYVPEPSPLLSICSLIGLAGSAKLLRRK